MHKKISSTLKATLLITLISATLVGCSTPEEKAQSFYKKGMALLEESPEKAKLEFQNALQNKKNMTDAMYGLVLVAERQSDLKATFGLLNNVLEQDPKHEPALVKRGQLLLAANKVDKALIDSNKALELNKNDPAALILHAAVMLKLDDRSAAVDYANQALKIDPNNPNANIVLATERMVAGDYPKAIEYLDSGLAKNPKNLVIYFIKINAYEKLKQLDNAQKLYEKMLVDFPTNTGIRKSYVQFLIAHENKVEAEKQIRKIADDSPKEITPKLDVIRFVFAVKGREEGIKTLDNYIKENPKEYQFQFALVDVYQAEKNDLAADTLLNNIVKEAGTSEDGLKAKGIIASNLLQNNKKEEAKKLATEILNLDKRNEQALLIKASLEIDAKQFETAIIDLRSILHDTPNSQRALLMLASAHEAAGSPELADEQYLKAFQVSKSSPQVGILYAAFLNRRNQPERADKIYEDILKKHPDNNEAFSAVAKAKMLKGDYAGAQALAEQAKKIGVNDIAADQILGDVFAGKKDMQASIAAFKRAHEAAPNNAQSIAAIVGTYLQFGKTKEANEFIDSVLSANPNNKDAQLMKAQLAMMLGNQNKSLAEFEQFIKENPKLIIGYQQLGLAYSHANKPEQALTTLKAGLVIEPKNVTLRMTIAGIYEQIKQYEEALKAYEDLYVEFPKESVLANNIASLMADNRTDKASLDRAYALAQTLKQSDLPQYLDTLGWVSYKVGKVDEAVIPLEKATQKMPKVAIFQYHLAKVYIAKNDKQRAKEALIIAAAGASEQKLSEKDEVSQLLKQL